MPASRATASIETAWKPSATTIAFVASSSCSRRSRALSRVAVSRVMPPEVYSGVTYGTVIGMDLPETADVPSHLYSFSFAPNPGWSRTYSRQPEILRYLRRCADDFGVRAHVRLGCAVAEARWDE